LSVKSKTINGEGKYILEEERECRETCRNGYGCGQKIWTGEGLTVKGVIRTMERTGDLELLQATSFSKADHTQAYLPWSGAVHEPIPKQGVHEIPVLQGRVGEKREIKRAVDQKKKKDPPATKTSGEQSGGKIIKKEKRFGPIIKEGECHASKEKHR